MIYDKRIVKHIAQKSDLPIAKVTKIFKLMSEKCIKDINDNKSTFYANLFCFYYPLNPPKKFYLTNYQRIKCAKYINKLLFTYEIQYKIRLYDPKTILQQLQNSNISLDHKNNPEEPL